MIFLTDFADQAVVLPLALVIALMLGLTGWTRGVLAWLLAVAGTFGAIVLLKIFFLVCGLAPPGAAVPSPSGHTASAAIIYGGLIALIARRCGVRLGWAFLPAPAAVLLIGLSRIELGAHTLAEVAIGGFVGCVGALAMLFLAGPPPPRLRLPRLVGPAVVVVLAMHGYHLRAEDRLKDFAGRYGWLVAVCADHGRP